MVGEMTKAMEYSAMPVGYIPMDYRGRRMSITGWQSYNNAMNGDATMMLGDALGKNIVKTQVKGVGAKNPFESTGSKKSARTKEDLDMTVEEKIAKEVERCVKGGK